MSKTTTTTTATTTTAKATAKTKPVAKATTATATETMFIQDDKAVKTLVTTCNVKFKLASLEAKIATCEDVDNNNPTPENTEKLAKYQAKRDELKESVDYAVYSENIAVFNSLDDKVQAIIRMIAKKTTQRDLELLEIQPRIIRVALIKGTDKSLKDSLKVALHKLVSTLPENPYFSTCKVLPVDNISVKQSKDFDEYELEELKDCKMSVATAFQSIMVKGFSVGSTSGLTLDTIKLDKFCKILGLYLYGCILEHDKALKVAEADKARTEALAKESK